MPEPTGIDAGARALREHVELAWDDAHVDALLARTKARARRRAVIGVAAAAAVIVIACGAALTWTAERESSIASAPPADASDRVIHLADGSRVIPLTRESHIVVVHVSDEDILLDVARGGARFEVVRGLPRSFRVLAGDVEVSVVGTVFEVRREGQQASVRVLEGHVRVRWPPDGEVLLGRGESGRFPRPVARASDQHTSGGTVAERDRSAASEAIADAPSHEDDEATEAPAEPPAVATGERAIEPEATGERVVEREAAHERAVEAHEPHARARPSHVDQEPAPPPAPWREHAERGEYEEAARLLAADEGALDHASLDELMLASDTLRLNGEPERALTFLDRAVQLAAGDARAPLVAFTRGRLLLGPLARFDDAADAFAAARALAPEGSLAADALAREVEALARAGRTIEARARAEEYVARHPNGLHVAAVRRFGGLAQPR